VAQSVSMAIDSVFKYFTIAESNVTNVAKEFSVIMARDNGVSAETGVVLVNPNAATEEEEQRPTGSPVPGNSF
jgi:hypothetical protein